MTHPHDAETARAVIQAMLNGEPPPSPIPELNGWRQVVEGMAEAYKRTGTPGARQAWATATKIDPKLNRLISTRGVEPEAPTTAGCPPLPAVAQAIYQDAAPCGAWLDQYIAFATEAAPMTPRSFHEAAGLFAVAVAVARRVCLQIGDHETIYPNLFALFLAPSTVYHKSTGLRLLEGVLQAAGLTHLLLPRKGSPEALVADLDPYKLPGKKTRDMELFLQRRAFAAQRGYLRDEVSSLFASFKREFNAGLLELILALYDSPAYYDEVTISRDEVVIRDACLSFFGASTPIEMGPHLSENALWGNGLWARFALIAPDEAPVYDFYRPSVQGLIPLGVGLRQMYRLFPSPRAEFVAGDPENPDPLEKQDHIVVEGQQPASPVTLAPGVWEAWEAYSRATGHTMLVSGGIDGELHANYGRFGTKLIKVAMLLAVMDADELPVTVELAHLARAQQIVEGWRASLHRVWNTNAETSEARLTRRVSDRLKATKQGMTCHQLTRLLRSNTKETTEALVALEKAGQVVMQQSTGANGRRVEVWVWASEK
jgi:hypothetical protein